MCLGIITKHDRWIGFEEISFLNVSLQNPEMNKPFFFGFGKGDRYPGDLGVKKPKLLDRSVEEGEGMVFQKNASSWKSPL